MWKVNRIEIFIYFQLNIFNTIQLNTYLIHFTQYVIYINISYLLTFRERERKNIERYKGRTKRDKELQERVRGHWVSSRAPERMLWPP